MLRSRFLLAALFVAVLPTAAFAAPGPGEASRASGVRGLAARVFGGGASRAPAPAAEAGGSKRQLSPAQRRAQRLVALRGRARFFSKIAVGRDYSGEHVVFRDPEVTAFLDLTDPAHPGYDPKRELDVDTTGLDQRRLTHVLVVPNQPREWITPTLDAPIQSRDLSETLQIMQKAEGLALKLGIQKARVFVNPDSFLSVGYLHVHILGERGAAPYPKLKP